MLEVTRMVLTSLLLSLVAISSNHLLCIQYSVDWIQFGNDCMHPHKYQDTSCMDDCVLTEYNSLSLLVNSYLLQKYLNQQLREQQRML